MKRKMLLLAVAVGLSVGATNSFALPPDPCRGKTQNIAAMQWASPWYQLLSILSGVV